MTLRYAELFAGVGGISIGLDRAGLRCSWHAEIEPFARRVLKARFPNVPLYGDVTQLNGSVLRAQHGPIDLLSGGSPCQDLSQAGRRAGIIDGEKSSLFFEQIRLWNELDAPFLLWENVFGAYSSGKGEDFRYVLSAMVGADTGRAVDKKGRDCKWARSGLVRGPTGISAAWRTVDAQFWGVPQRRRRILVLASRARSVDPFEVLAQLESVRGHYSASGTPGQEIAASTGDCARLASGDAAEGCDASGSRGGAGDSRPKVLTFDWQAGGDTSDKSFRGQSRVYIVRKGEYTGALQAQKRDALLIYDEPGVLAFNAHSNAQDLNRRDSHVAPPLKVGDDAGAGSPPAVIVFDVKQSGESADGVAPTMRAMVHNKSHANGGGQLGVVVDTAIVFDAVQITSPANQSRVDLDGPAPTLSRHSKMRVARMQAFGQYEEDGTASALKARDYKDVTDIVYTVNSDSRGAHEENRAAPVRSGRRSQQGLVVGALEARPKSGFPGTDGSCSGHVQVSCGVPRRLLPVECEKLQGWPAGHTDVSDDTGKPAKDAPRYKAIGNGVASPCVEWVGRELIAAVERAAVQEAA